MIVTERIYHIYQIVDFEGISPLEHTTLILAIISSKACEYGCGVRSILRRFPWSKEINKRVSDWPSGSEWAPA